jgi:predicted Zn-ribbon and HTH transcriptional regulator
MDPGLVLLELIFAVTLMRGLLVAAKVLPPACGRCGHQFERRELGEPVCRCGH